eukprot:115692-Chlamydomonas_euryale.AAC.5
MPSRGCHTKDAMWRMPIKRCHAYDAMRMLPCRGCQLNDNMHRVPCGRCHEKLKGAYIPSSQHDMYKRCVPGKR